MASSGRQVTAAGLSNDKTVLLASFKQAIDTLLIFGVVASLKKDVADQKAEWNTNRESALKEILGSLRAERQKAETSSTLGLLERLVETSPTDAEQLNSLNLLLAKQIDLIIDKENSARKYILDAIKIYASLARAYRTIDVEKIDPGSHFWGLLPGISSQIKLLSMPNKDKTDDSAKREEKIAQLNAVLSKISKPLATPQEKVLLHTYSREGFNTELTDYTSYLFKELNDALDTLKDELEDQDIFEDAPAGTQKNTESKDEAVTTPKKGRAEYDQIGVIKAYLKVVSPLANSPDLSTRAEFKLLNRAIHALPLELPPELKIDHPALLQDIHNLRDQIRSCEAFKQNISEISKGSTEFSLPERPASRRDHKEMNAWMSAVHTRLKDSKTFIAPPEHKKTDTPPVAPVTPSPTVTHPTKASVVQDNAPVEEKKHISSDHEKQNPSREPAPADEKAASATPPLSRKKKKKPKPKTARRHDAVIAEAPTPAPTRLRANTQTSPTPHSMPSSGTSSSSSFAPAPQPQSQQPRKRSEETKSNPASNVSTTLNSGTPSDASSAPALKSGHSFSSTGKSSNVVDDRINHTSLMLSSGTSSSSSSAPAPKPQASNQSSEVKGDDVAATPQKSTVIKSPAQPSTLNTAPSLLSSNIAARPESRPDHPFKAELDELRDLLSTEFKIFRSHGMTPPNYPEIFKTKLETVQTALIEAQHDLAKKTINELYNTLFCVHGLIIDSNDMPRATQALEKAATIRQKIAGLSAPTPQPPITNREIEVKSDDDALVAIANLEKKKSIAGSVAIRSTFAGGSAVGATTAGGWLGIGALTGATITTGGIAAAAACVVAAFAGVAYLFAKATQYMTPPSKKKLARVGAATLTAAGGVATSTCLLTGVLVFGTANFWNPVGWITLGVCAAGLLVGGSYLMAKAYLSSTRKNQSSGAAIRPSSAPTAQASQASEHKDEDEKKVSNALTPSASFSVPAALSAPARQSSSAPTDLKPAKATDSERERLLTQSSPAASSVPAKQASSASAAPKPAHGKEERLVRRSLPSVRQPQSGPIPIAAPPLTRSSGPTLDTTTPDDSRASSPTFSSRIASSSLGNNPHTLLSSPPRATTAAPVAHGSSSPSHSRGLKI